MRSNHRRTCFLCLAPLTLTLVYAVRTIITREQHRISCKFTLALGRTGSHKLFHQDVSEQNLVWARTDFKRGSFNIPAGTMFYIDLGSTRVLPSGPRSGVRIRDFRFHGGKFIPPEGLDAVEPYAYDIFALGKTFIRFTTVRQLVRLQMVLPILIFSSASGESTRTTIFRVAGMSGVLRWGIQSPRTALPYTAFTASFLP